MRNAASVKARLANYAKANGITFQEALVYYGLEKTVQRISESDYSDRFVLKGGILLFALLGKSFTRATTDIDLLAEHLTNDREEIKKVFAEIFSIQEDDCLFFDLDSLKVENIAEFKEYHGLNVSIIGYIDKTRIPVSLDIGYGDSISDGGMPIDYPSLLDGQIRSVMSYSLETVIAEKLEAIASKDMLNSRYKDYYDMYVISENFDFEAGKLKNAIEETFANRKTPFGRESLVFLASFSNDQTHQKRWKDFTKKKKALLSISLEDVVERLETFVLPLVTHDSDANNLVWDHASAKWE